MSLLSPPKIPLFRITHFYGPEALEGDSETIHCVFNVKKRSWKGGVQVDIVIGENQIQRLENQLEFSSWMQELLQIVPDEDRGEFSKKGLDLFTQMICYHKLELYIRQGIKQENTQISAEAFVLETDAVVKREVKNIKQQIMVELDLEEFKRG